ncbi:hypothetical protein K0M31_015845 [Melipona bicolor]|uniref:RNA helicase n=1 Tax=Melipona bicolor TaxID=60889 RepID=A0AA40FER5_9HYME|nr:hypothetical protein K0M31_015845 [Melipona bicolor]
MSLFPLDPRFTKVILASAEHQCLEEALTVVALLSGESVFTDPPAKRQQAYVARSRFASPEGDHVMLLKRFPGVQQHEQKKAWCHENFLHHRNLEYAASGATTARHVGRTREPGEGQLRDKYRNNSGKRSLRASTIISPNCREIRTYLTVSSKQPVAIHPSSTLHGSKPSLILFTEIVATGRCYLRGLSVIDSSWLAEKGFNIGKHD